MEEQSSNVFRKKSMDIISSPDQLNDYLKVTSPSVWIILGSVLLMLIALLAWSFFGEIEIVAEGRAVVKDGVAAVVMKKEDRGEMKPGMTVRFDQAEYQIECLETDDFGRTTAYFASQQPDGSYNVSVVLDVVHLIEFWLS